MKNKRRLIKPDTIFSILIHILLFAFLLLVLYPFISAFFGSFKRPDEILVSTKLLPEKWLFENYVKAWTVANFSQYTWNSVWYTALTVIVTILTSTCNGYAFARGDFRGKGFILALFTSLMFISLGTSSLYPTMQLMKLFNLHTSLMGLVIKGFFAIHIADMYLVRGFINQLPKELDEAATIDGCSFIGIFFRIILPLLMPMVATLAILSFSGAWNNYLWPMIVTMSNPASQPLAVGLRALKDSGEAAAAWDLVLAGSMISAIPMIIIYLIFNKYFVRGIASGAVKG
ncbi:MAG: carbohydrate ABC transporter permease [Clostridia bacterium]|nr:carbohydrate ABC transporter permease [Clostridia bacterium]